MFLFDPMNIHFILSAVLAACFGAKVGLAAFAKGRRIWHIVSGLAILGASGMELCNGLTQADKPHIHAIEARPSATNQAIQPVKDYMRLYSTRSSPVSNTPVFEVSIRSDGVFDVFGISNALVFTIRVRGTNLFLTTTNDASLDTFWGPDDKWEIRFQSPKEAK